MKTFKVKFFGSKNRKERISKQSTTVEADSSVEVLPVLILKGWVVIHGLKIREV